MTKEESRNRTADAAFRKLYLFVSFNKAVYNITNHMRMCETLIFTV
jgi:hypothetical protein